jgi:hypothetical protein
MSQLGNLALLRPVPRPSDLWIATVGTTATAAIDVLAHLGIDPGAVTDGYVCRVTAKVGTGDGSTRVGIIAGDSTVAAPLLAATNGSDPTQRCTEVRDGESFIVTRSRRWLRLVASANTRVELHFEV